MRDSADEENDIVASTFENAANWCRSNPTWKGPDCPICELDIALRIQNVINNIGIYTAQQLVRTSRSTFEKYRSFNSKKLRFEIADAMQKALNALTGEHRQ